MHIYTTQIEDMKKRLFKGHKQIREKELENSKLDEYVQDLAVSVAQREKIIKVRGIVTLLVLFCLCTCTLSACVNQGV